MKLKKILLVIVFTFFMILNVRASDISLTGIIIDGVPLEGFDPEVESYDLSYPSSKESVRIGYTFDQDQFNVTTGGSSNLTLKSGKNVFTITIASKDNPSEKRTYTLNILREDARSNDNTLSSLTVAGKKVQLYSDKYNYDVEIDNSLKKVEIKATTSSAKATFVQGYGERIGNNQVTLSNGDRTTVEIKVQAENESIQTYTITIIKSNYKSNDATLKDIKIKEKNFNFNPDILEYNIEVENEIDKINVEALANHEKAKVEYEKEVELKEGINNLVIKVTAEDGTVKEYKLNITRKAEVALVSDIEIEDIDFEFKPDVYQYEIKTTLVSLKFKVTLNSKTATYEIINNDDLQDGSIIRIVVKDKDKQITYNFKIINPDKKVTTTTPNDIDDAATNVSGSGFLKKYEMYIGLITFGVGLLSLLIVLITRKDSQIM